MLDVEDSLRTSHSAALDLPTRWGLYCTREAPEWARPYILADRMASPVTPPVAPQVRTEDLMGRRSPD
jgi:hypothetical protein